MNPKFLQTQEMLSVCVPTWAVNFILFIHLALVWMIRSFAEQDLIIMNGLKLRNIKIIKLCWIVLIKNPKFSHVLLREVQIIIHAAIKQVIHLFLGLKHEAYLIRYSRNTTQAKLSVYPCAHPHEVSTLLMQWA